MSDSELHDFLRDARGETEEARFERDAAAGLIPEAEYARRIRLVGRPESPLVVRVGFRSADGWENYFAEYESDVDGSLPMAPGIADDRPSTI
jgi:hypothetical protein